jgi:DHA2 family multidrug resistance protein-like MFS transporter
VAERLQGEIGAGLLDSARDAFTQGLQVTAAISAAVAVGMAILAAVLLRRVPPGPELEARVDPDQESATAALSRPR